MRNNVTRRKSSIRRHLRHAGVSRRKKSLTAQQKFGANVRRQRILVGWTQEKLAKKSDLHPRALQKIEAGEVDPVVSTIVRIRKALKCSWKDLFRRT